jgi:ATP-dependent exoDNAse (exonuclease V) alpha subunit
VHGYAGTVYAAQGRTVPASVMHLARATDSREVYVGLTRHIDDAWIVVESDRLDALCRRRQADPRMKPTSNDMLADTG